MKCAKLAAGSSRRVGSITAATFVHAARFVSSLLTATLTFEFLVGVFFFPGIAAIWVGLVLLLSLILATWIIAAVMGTVLLLARRLWAMSQDRILRARRWTGARSGLWDEWLDGYSGV
jgi:hypothetical protein